ncbi:MAG: metal ABC transporter permease [Terrimicrobiaceae bacterium]
MSWITEPFQYEFMRRALLACVLIGFTNGFLGAYVVLRRLALVADALSHSMLPGLALAAILIGLNTGGLLLGGLFAATFVALGGHFIASSSRMKDETAVAALYILAFGLGIALIKHARVQVSLEHFLFGNILGIADSDLWTSYAISTITLLTLVALQRPLLLALFEASVARTQGVKVGPLLALIVVLIVLAMISSLQAVGVLLSLGLLVFPAATIYLLCDSYAAMSWGGAVLGMVGGVIGLLISFWANIPSGPAIVMVLGVFFVLAYLFGPKYGMISRWIRQRHLHEESLRRWK